MLRCLQFIDTPVVMDSLPKETQAEIKGLTVARLIARLIKAGYDEETISGMKREQLAAEWAECVLAGKEHPATVSAEAVGRPTIAVADLELQKQWLQLEQMRFETERELKRREIELKESEQKSEQMRFETERELRRREIELKEQEIALTAKRDKDDKERKDTLASQMRFYHAAIKNSFAKFPHDPAELPAFFDHIENLFTMYEVPDDLRGPLLQANLSDKAKALTVRLSCEQVNNYQHLKAFLLNEFRITPLQLRERFYLLRKLPDESYSMLQSKLANALTFYLRSRKADDSYQRLFNLICSDRLKELIPRPCLDFVLAQEKNDWLEPAELSAAIDTYLASHFVDGKPKGIVIPAVYNSEGKDYKRFTTTAAETKPQFVNVGGDKGGEHTGSRRCFNCGGPHLKRDCPKRSSNVGGNSDRPSGNRRNDSAAKTRACMVQCTSEPVAGPGPQNTPAVREEASDALVCRGAVLPIISRPAVSGRVGDGVSVVKHGEGNQLSDAYANSECGESCVDVNDIECYQCPYTDVEIKHLSRYRALIDSGSNTCCINANLIKDNALPVVKQIYLSGLSGQPTLVDVVRLHLKPVIDEPKCINVAPAVHAFFAVVPGLNEEVIITPHVHQLLQDVAKYNVLAPDMVNVVNMVDDGDSVMTNECADANDCRVTRSVESVVSNDGVNGEVQSDQMTTEMEHLVVSDCVHTEASVNSDASTRECDFVDPENVIKIPSRSATANELAIEQKACPSLHDVWELARQNKGGFFVQDGLLYHRDKISGQSVIQLVLPMRRQGIVLSMAHDANFAGHLATDKTLQRIRLTFWFPCMKNIVRQYCASCDICQKRAPIRVSHRVPITPIPRDEELPFTHLVMDCIGPIVQNNDPVASKPMYNYALVVVDKFTRWPMAYPLRSMTAKAVCEALLQLFFTFSIPKVISSDCGSNFKSSLTQEMLERLGCSPRFSTPGHPEAQGITERCNQSIKGMLFKLVNSNPNGWEKLLPFILWSLREAPNSTTHCSPFLLLFGRQPRGPLSVLKETWAGERELPLNLGKGPEEYLQSLKENLEIARVYAEIYSQHEQKKYADHYNLRSSDRKFQLGDKVLILAPDFGGRKLYSRWQGPGVVTKILSPYSYVVEIDGKQRHLHANKIRKYTQRIEQAVVNSCSVIYEKDGDFGEVAAADLGHAASAGEQQLSDRLDPAKVMHLSANERRQLFDILNKYPAVFSERPGFCSILEHEIKVTPEFVPKRLRAYKVPELLKPEVDRQIKEMLELGIIKPSNSEMASPIVCVLKGSNGQNGVRITVDFRYVNKYSVGSAYPIHDVNSVIQKVARANCISTFDAKAAFWQIGLKAESQPLSAFICDSGLFEFTRMPFGLKTASNTCVDVISRILYPLRDFTAPFVDDMAVVSDNWPEHLCHLDKFLRRIEESGLTLNLNKCDFGRSQVRFVGHVCGSGKIGPDPIKLSTLQDIRAPVTKRDVRRLIGFLSYFRSFIPSFSEKARVITDLTQKKAPNKIIWEHGHQLAFERLKEDLSNAVALHSVEFGADFGLLVDASASAVGCCLIQWAEDGITEKPLAFASMKLSETQSKWATIEREAYAVIWALKKFRSWIFGSKIIVYSDHNPLLYLTEAAPKSAKLTRWSLALQEFNIDFRYRAGRQNIAADFLSRI